MTYNEYTELFVFCLSHSPYTSFTVVCFSTLLQARRESRSSRSLIERCLSFKHWPTQFSEEIQQRGKIPRRAGQIFSFFYMNTFTLSQTSYKLATNKHIFPISLLCHKLSLYKGASLSCNTCVH